MKRKRVDSVIRVSEGVSSYVSLEARGRLKHKEEMGWYKGILSPGDLACG